jgi:hypothetical protein
VGVTLDVRGTERVVVVDGDLAVPATLIQLRGVLSALAYTDTSPVVVDLSAATGASAGVTRLLTRTAVVMAHRGVQFRVASPALVRT